MRFPKPPFSLTAHGWNDDRSGENQGEKFNMQPLACNSKWLAATLSPDALITSLSYGAEQFTGYSPQELVGRPITHILSDSTAFEMTRILDAANQWGHWQGEIVHSTRGGKSLDARGTLSSLAGSGNRSAGYLFISNLNTASARDECEDVFLAEVAGKLRAFAHDLNNPLAVMMGFTQLLILNNNCQGTVRGDVEKLYTELKRVIQVVEKMHQYAMSMYEKPGKLAASG
jgi:PAS domain S-box-containing protein